MAEILRVSVTGIDGSGKSTVTDLVARNLGENSRVARVAIPAYSIVNGERRNRFSTLLSVVDGLHRRADETGNPNIVMAANALNVLLQGRVIEPYAVHKIQPNIIIGSRDYLIDPSVYAIFYSPRLARREMGRRLELMQQLTGLKHRDIVFRLTLPPQEAAKRIAARIADQTPDSSRDGRRRWPHMHEGPDNLRRLQSEYDSALREVARRTDTRIVEIDTSKIDQYEVADVVTTTINQFLTIPETSKIGNVTGLTTARGIRVPVCVDSDTKSVDSL